MHHVWTHRDLQWQVGDYRHDHLLHHHGPDEGFESASGSTFLPHGDFGQFPDQILNVVFGEAQGDGFEGVGDPLGALDEVEVYCLSFHCLTGMARFVDRRS